MKLELKKIRSQREEWLDAVNSNDIERVKSLLTDDAVWIPLGMPALNGKKAIADWMHPFFDTYQYKFSINELDVKGAGDWAVEHASFTSRLQPRDSDGNISEHRGKYIIIWRWEKDNKWRIERYLDNTDSKDN